MTQIDSKKGLVSSKQKSYNLLHTSESGILSKDTEHNFMSSPYGCDLFSHLITEVKMVLHCR